MKLRAHDREPLMRAMDLALDWHGDQVRKGTQLPYLSHLLQVAGLVLEHGGSVQQAVAALLHDSLEDAPEGNARAQREQAIRDAFGPEVLGIVRDCTDTEEGESKDNKAPWRLRKERYLKHLATASERTALVAACDKRHNLAAIVGDARAIGPALWERFNASPPEQVWYFEGVVEALGPKVPDRLRQELEDLLDDLREMVEALA